jgi:methyltransferase family protein
MDERFVFDEDELRIADYVFQLGGSYASDAWRTAPKDRFLMYKPRNLLEMFDEFFSSRQDNEHFRNVFEIGVWDGGSTAFWFEYFQPDKLVAVDWLKREDSDYFRHYVDSRGIADRLTTYWGVDQGDAERLNEIIDAEFATGPLDLVIDDGSHLLEETRTSFQTLFPLLRQGGFYMVEDWNWELFPEFFRAPNHPFAKRDGLVALVTDLSCLTGTSNTIRSLTIYRGFVAVERGPGLEGQKFDLQEHLSGLPTELRSTRSSN